ncbi:hypothetical protein AD998_13745 [bacterium 336/3]|jgi:SpoIIAA-like|nr:hypothetical protein AD998_13745 [bacterium 336/3]
MLESSLFYETENYTLYSEQNSYLKIDWKTKVASEQIRQGLQEALEVMQASGIKKLVSNTIQCSSSWTSSNEWIASTWLPQALQNGLQRVAFVTSDDVMQKISIDNLKTKLQKKYRFIYRYFQVFQQEKNALDWLSES